MEEASVECRMTFTNILTDNTIHVMEQSAEIDQQFIQTSTQYARFVECAEKSFETNLVQYHDEGISFCAEYVNADIEFEERKQKYCDTGIDVYLKTQFTENQSSFEIISTDKTTTSQAGSYNSTLTESVIKRTQNGICNIETKLVEMGSKTFGETQSAQQLVDQEIKTNYKDAQSGYVKILSDIQTFNDIQTSEVSVECSIKKQMVDSVSEVRQNITESLVDENNDLDMCSMGTEVNWKHKISENSVSYESIWCSVECEKDETTDVITVDDTPLQESSYKIMEEASLECRMTFTNILTDNTIHVTEQSAEINQQYIQTSTQYTRLVKYTEKSCETNLVQYHNEGVSFCAEYLKANIEFKESKQKSCDTGTDVCFKTQLSENLCSFEVIRTFDSIATHSNNKQTNEVICHVERKLIEIGSDIFREKQFEQQLLDYEKKIIFKNSQSSYVKNMENIQSYFQNQTVDSCINFSNGIRMIDSGSEVQRNTIESIIDEEIDLDMSSMGTEVNLKSKTTNNSAKFELKWFSVECEKDEQLHQAVIEEASIRGSTAEIFNINIQHQIDSKKSTKCSTDVHEQLIESSNFTEIIHGSASGTTTQSYNDIGSEAVKKQTENVIFNIERKLTEIGSETFWTKQCCQQLVDQETKVFYVNIQSSYNKDMNNIQTNCHTQTTDIITDSNNKIKMNNIVSDIEQRVFEAMVDEEMDTEKMSKATEMNLKSNTRETSVNYELVWCTVECEKDEMTGVTTVDETILEKSSYSIVQESSVECGIIYETADLDFSSKYQETSIQHEVLVNHENACIDIKHEHENMSSNWEPATHSFGVQVSLFNNVDEYSCHVEDTRNIQDVKLQTNFMLQQIERSTQSNIKFYSDASVSLLDHNIKNDKEFIVKYIKTHMNSEITKTIRQILEDEGEVMDQYVQTADMKTQLSWIEEIFDREELMELLRGERYFVDECQMTDEVNNRSVSAQTDTKLFDEIITETTIHELCEKELITVQETSNLDEEYVDARFSRYLRELRENRLNETHAQTDQFATRSTGTLAQEERIETFCTLTDFESEEMNIPEKERYYQNKLTAFSFQKFIDEDYNTNKNPTKYPKHQLVSKIEDDKFSENEHITTTKLIKSKSDLEEMNAVNMKHRGYSDHIEPSNTENILPTVSQSYTISHELFSKVDQENLSSTQRIGISNSTGNSTENNLCSKYSTITESAQTERTANLLERISENVEERSARYSLYTSKSVINLEIAIDQNRSLSQMLASIEFVIDPQSLTRHSYEIALSRNWIDSITGTYVNPSTGENMPLELAVNQNYVVLREGAQVESFKTRQVGLLRERIFQEENEVKIKDVLDTSSGILYDEVLAKEMGLLLSNGDFSDKQANVILNLKDAVEQRYIDIELDAHLVDSKLNNDNMYKIVKVYDTLQRSWISFGESVSQGLIITNKPSFIDTEKNETLDFETAHYRKLLDIQEIKSMHNLYIINSEMRRYETEVRELQITNTTGAVGGTITKY